MGKKRSNAKRPLQEAPDAPLNNPFAGLASLRDELPSTNVAGPEPEPTAVANGITDQPSRVVVRRERKGRGGKTIIRVLGLGTGDDLAAWERRLKTTLGCGGTTEGDDVLLTGDIGDRVASALTAAGIERVIRGN